MSAVTNISCYRFARLTGLKLLREELISLGRESALRGTILLSREGINLFLAGERSSIDSLIDRLREVPGLEGLEPKFSVSEHQPFTRLVVRIKKEIIAFGVDGIDPGSHTSPKLPAETLKQWLDEGRSLTLLDTRNDYEVRLGTFEGAMALGLDTFREFPAAVDRLPAEMKQTPIVMFCTGGIRCEKAGPYMERAGFKNVFQLDGGILKYFEQVGGAHYHGECFVFDQRVGVDPALRETSSAQCYVCQSPLTADEQSDTRFVPGKSCPYCFRTNAEQMQASIERRHNTLRSLARPLPGSIPYDNVRPVQIPPEWDGHPLVDALAGIFPHHPRERWHELCEAGRLLAPDGSVSGPGTTVRCGERIRYVMPAITEPDVNANIRILYEDEAIIAVNKPAPLPMHPSGRFHKNSLQFFLSHAYAPERPRPAHRLDANTTGVVLWSRTRHVARLLQPQFANGGVEKVYLVRVIGHPATDTFACHAAISDEPGALGSRAIDEAHGLSAHTDFLVLRREHDGTALLEARPHTGRTNQIRLHLSHLGHPVLGDQAYLQSHQAGITMTPGPTDPPLCLHAYSITFRHPLTNQPTTFTAPPPAWADQAHLQKLQTMKEVAAKPRHINFASFGDAPGPLGGSESCWANPRDSATLGTMNYPKSPAEKVGGIVYFGRMLEKVRLHQAGELHPDLHANLGKGFDERCVDFLGVSYDALCHQVAEGLDDEAALEWCFSHGKRPSTLEIEVWNDFMRKRGWNDDISDILTRRKMESGLESRDDIQTMFQYIDADEGRF